MSKIYTQNGRICPFCGFINFVDYDDCSEHVREVECNKCELGFKAYEIFNVTHVSIGPSKK